MIKWFGYIIFFLTLVSAVFWSLISNNDQLLTSDAAVRGANWSLQDVIQRLGPYWHDAWLLGSPRVSGGQLANVLKGVTSGQVWNNGVYALACFLSSLVFVRYCLSKKISAMPAVLGAVMAFWVGSNFTIIAAGHNYKPYIVLFFMCSLLPVAAAAAGSLLHGVIWGACIGLMFAQQPDVALFFALVAGVYLVFHLWQAHGVKPLRWMKIMIPAAAIAFLFAAGPLLSGYKHYVKGATQMNEGGADAKWEYVTQWSWPPEDSIDFVAPGYMGWGTGRPDGPYWGRCGRSAGFEQTGQGFKNFRLDAYYYGMIGFGFALFGLFTFRRSENRKEIMFWSGAAVLTLLLAFGKYTPLYALFFKLPVVSNIRSPVKFLQVFQVCAALLAAFGMSTLFTCENEKKQALAKRFFLGLSALLSIFVLAALAQTISGSEWKTSLVKAGWPDPYAETILANRLRALWHVAAMTVLLAGTFALYGFQRFKSLHRYGKYLAGILVVVVTADAAWVARKYISKMPRSYIEPNALTHFLDQHLGHERIAFLSQEGINNIWITYLMPYNRIPSFNYTDMPRTSPDYKQFLTAGQRDPLNMWRTSSVKYLLGPSQAEQQLKAVNCPKVFSYTLTNAGDGEFNVMPDPNGPYAVYELDGAVPRYTLLAESRKVTDDQALANMGETGIAMLSEDSELPGLSGRGSPGAVEVLSYRPGNIELRIRTEQAGILRAAEKYNPDWKATLDGKPARVERVDFVCLGMHIPPGDHTVTLRYAPGRLFFYMQIMGVIILAVALLLLAIRRKRSDVAD